MSIKSGFFNSLNGDRRYSAEDISSIFDGILKDGVFPTIGSAFRVTATSENVVNIGIGKAWFNHTWISNDSVLPMELPEANAIQDRIDAIVLDINNDETVRENTIQIVQGTPSIEPIRPELTNTDKIEQHPLCYIYRTRGSTEIVQDDITYMVGTTATPFAGLVSVEPNELLASWEAMLNAWIDTIRTHFDGELGVHVEDGKLYIGADLSQGDDFSAIT